MVFFSDLVIPIKSIFSGGERYPSLPTRLLCAYVLNPIDINLTNKQVIGAEEYLCCDVGRISQDSQHHLTFTCLHQFGRILCIDSFSIEGETVINCTRPRQSSIM